MPLVPVGDVTFFFFYAVFLSGTVVILSLGFLHRYFLSLLLSLDGAQFKQFHVN